jgi:Lipoxygenase
MLWCNVMPCAQASVHIWVQRFDGFFGAELFINQFFSLLVLTQTDICMQTHLGKTHLAMEPFSVATRAYLPTTHPLGVLLRAHTRFMVFNNDLARKTLIAPDGPTDKLLAGESSLQ